MFDLTQDDDDDDDEFSTKYTKRKVFESDSDLEVSEGYFGTNIVKVGVLEHHRRLLALPKGKERCRDLDLMVVFPILS